MLVLVTVTLSVGGKASHTPPEHRLRAEEDLEIEEAPMIFPRYRYPSGGLVGLALRVHVFHDQKVVVRLASCRF